MTVDDIKQEWIKMGWHNYSDYAKFINNLDRSSIEEISQKLNPDSISASVFWKACDEHFGTDGVCNARGNENPLRIESANAQNYKLFKQSCGVEMMDMVVHSIRNLTTPKGAYRPKNIIEVGCGYGAFINHYKDNITDFDYTPFDVVSRFDGVQLLNSTPQGFFNDEFIDKNSSSVGCILCFNVMQHMSILQVNNYLKQFSVLLHDYGYLVISYVRTLSPPASLLYGQLIPLMMCDEFANAIEKLGFKILIENKQYVSGFDPYTLLCQKIK
jgi:hypothetical protein